AKDVDADTSKFITDGKYKNGVLLGGTGAVSEAGETSLTKLEMTIERVYGKTRYTTSQEINKKYAALFTGKKMAVATGENFPDALAGGGLCAKLKMPVVLVSDKAADSALEYIKGAAPEGLIVLGGAGAVSDEVAVKLAGGVKLPAAEADKK
ncbi:MAG: cell wall-binding repeat-containing protein, partial [Ruminococcaceae bacterium]|nr:cell wall-binding repeat-containing protein [Oscillospiraceae bacterium]